MSEEVFEYYVRLPEWEDEDLDDAWVEEMTDKILSIDPNAEVGWVGDEEGGSYQFFSKMTPIHFPFVDLIF